MYIHVRDNILRRREHVKSQCTRTISINLSRRYAYSQSTSTLSVWCTEDSQAEYQSEHKSES